LVAKGGVPDHIASQIDAYHRPFAPIRRDFRRDIDRFLCSPNGKLTEGWTDFAPKGGKLI
jgi:hypothetical protein